MPSTRIKAALKESWALDLTRWSNDPQVSNAVDTIAADLQSLPSFIRITNNRKRALRILILNLYLRWLEAPSGSLAYSRNKNNYTIPERYNPSKIGYRPTKSVVDGLADLGYVNKLAMGFHSRTGGKSRMSRMAATTKLIDTLEKTHGVDGSMIDVHSRSETIILRKKNKNDKQRDVGYNDTKLTKSRRILLQDYNQLLRSKYIDIDLQGHPDPVRINLANKFVRRIFINQSFKQGGRFYGGWWQNMPREFRPRILIKTKPTIELDFSGNQVMTAYAESGIDYFSSGKGDPYILPNYGSQHRNLFKKVMLAALNSSSRPSAKKAIQDEVNKGKYSLPTGRFVEDILTAFETFHKDIHLQFFSAQPGHFQFLDSEVAAIVIDYMTRDENEVVLCMHDSFIIVEDKENAVRRKMAEALEEVLIKHTPLPAVTARINNTDFWIDKTKRDPIYLIEVGRHENVQRWVEWRQTRRQGVLVYEPTNP